MTRIKILAPLVAIACLTLSVAAYQQAGRGQAQARVVDVDKLRDNLYVLRGGGGNTAIFIAANGVVVVRSEEHTSELQSRENLVCRLLLEKKKTSYMLDKE